MRQRLTDSIVRKLPIPPHGNQITYDSEVKGFGARVTTGGARSFILNYRTRGGRERRFTIGSFPEWKVVAARKEAADWKKRIDQGDDPLATIEADRQAPTVADLCDRFLEEHLPKKRTSTQRDYRAAVDNDIWPEMRHLKVADVTFGDIDNLHRKITKRGAPYLANRRIAVLSKMFNLAVRWGWRADNPVRGLERNPENSRRRYLSGSELARLTVALAEHSDRQAANVIRLLLLTGARRSEVQAAKWEDINLEEGVWTKPGATTKQKTDHRIPLSAPARQLLAELHAIKTKTGSQAEHVFPGRGSKKHRVELKDNWAALCDAAEIEGARLHDLRHTYASILASAGLSLPIIGALLGHTQPATTARYAHLFDDPLRAATERVGTIVSNAGTPKGDVVPIKGKS